MELLLNKRSRTTREGEDIKITPVTGRIKFNDSAVEKMGVKPDNDSFFYSVGNGKLYIYSKNENEDHPQAEDLPGYKFTKEQTANDESVISKLTKELDIPQVERTVWQTDEETGVTLLDENDQPIAGEPEQAYKTMNFTVSEEKEEVEFDDLDEPLIAFTATLLDTEEPPADRVRRKVRGENDESNDEDELADDLLIS